MHSDWAQEVHPLLNGNGLTHSDSHGGAPPTPTMLQDDVPHTQVARESQAACEGPAHKFEIVIAVPTTTSLQLSHAPPPPPEPVAEADATVEETVP